MNRFSIRTRLILILTLILLSGFLTTNIISYTASRKLVRTSIIGDNLPLARDNIYSEIQRDLMRPIFVSSLMANDTFLKDWVIAGEKGLPHITRYLLEVKQQYGFFTSFFISDRTRHYYHFKGLHKIISRDDDHDSWYYEFKAMNVEYDLDVDTDQAQDNRLTIFINHRLTDYAGHFLGVVGVGLNFDMVAGILDSYKEKYDRNVYMVDSQGLIQVHTHREHILKTNIFEQEGIRDIAGNLLGSKDEPSLLEYDKADEHYLTTCRYIKELDWYLLVEQNQTRAMAAVNKTFVKNLLLSLLITLFTILGTILVINYFQKQLEILATRDKLTRAFNRNEFERRYNYLAGMEKRDMLKLSIILFDIDRFKVINDTHGHVFGDAVIRKIADIAREITRENDILVRWGGDEFILLSIGDIEHARTIAQRLKDGISSHDFYSDHNVDSDLTGPVTVSCGIAQHLPEDDLDAFVNRADQALYAAKDRGRNCIVY